MWWYSLTLAVQYFPQFLLGLLVNLGAWIVVPIALLFCGPQDENLPEWASWYDEIDYGINGDPYWKGPEHSNGHEREYLWRLRWLLRNTATTFATKVQGFEYNKDDRFYAFGDSETSDQPVGHSGSIIATVITEENKQYHMFYGVQRIGNTSYCVRVYLGYKLMSVVHGVDSGSNIMFVYHLSIRKFVT